MIVAQQRRLHLVDELAEVLPVGRNGVPFRAELLVVRVGREEVDVSQVGRIVLAQIGDQPPESGKIRGARLVAKEIAVEGRVRADAGHQRVELRPLGRIVERLRGKQPILKLCPQAVALGHVQLLLRTPDEVPAAVGHLLGDRIGHGRAGPVGDDGSAHLPRRGRVPASRPPSRGKPMTATARSMAVR